jgi:hypothetical protein
VADVGQQGLLIQHVAHLVMVMVARAPAYREHDGVAMAGHTDVTVPLGASGLQQDVDAYRSRTVCSA